MTKSLDGNIYAGVHGNTTHAFETIRIFADPCEAARWVEMREAKKPYVAESYPEAPWPESEEVVRDWPMTVAARCGYVLPVQPGEPSYDAWLASRTSEEQDKVRAAVDAYRAYTQRCEGIRECWPDLPPIDGVSPDQVMYASHLRPDRLWVLLRYRWAVKAAVTSRCNGRLISNSDARQIRLVMENLWRIPEARFWIGVFTPSMANDLFFHVAALTAAVFPSTTLARKPPATTAEGAALFYSLLKEYRAINKNHALRDYLTRR